MAIRFIQVLFASLFVFNCGTNERSSAIALDEEDECYEAEEFICAVESEIIQLTNEYRGNLAPMIYARKLTFASRSWSSSQGRRGSIGHDGFTAERYQTIRNHFGGTDGVRISSENVAMSGGLDADDAEAVARQFARMWWNSSGHRRNMLGNYSHIGVGVYQAGPTTFYATQIFGSEN